MNGFIDIHHHLIFGLDDGAGDEAMSRKMADRAAEQGIRTIFATTHAYPGVREFDRAAYEERLDALNAYCREQEYELEILSGAEIRYSQSMVRGLEQGELPTMNNTRFVLTEWSNSADSDQIYQAVREISNAGYIVIMAHIERCRNMRRELELIDEMKRSFQMRVQVDCESLLDGGLAGFRMRSFACSLIEQELVDYVATDAHDLTTRRARMEETYQYLRKKFGKNTARALTGLNQLELINPDGGR